MKVRQLGYLVFECAPGVQAQMELVYGDVIGAQLETDVVGRTCVRLDGRRFRIRLETGAQNRLKGIGWEVAPSDILPLVERLAAKGHEIIEADADTARDRHAVQVFAFTDEDGFHHELYVEQEFTADPELDALFVCGTEENGIFGLGHLVQIASDRAKMQAMYTDLLGFGLSDRITWPDADLFFLHCNQRHHTMALSAEALGLKAGMIHHLMLEGKSRAQIDRAYAALKDHGFPVLLTIGQHTNDEVYSFYMLTPAGFAIEFGCGGRVVEDPATWQFARYDAPSSWGHELQLL